MGSNQWADEHGVIYCNSVALVIEVVNPYVATKRVYKVRVGEPSKGYMYTHSTHELPEDAVEIAYTLLKVKQVTWSQGC